MDLTLSKWPSQGHLTPCVFLAELWSPGSISGPLHPMTGPWPLTSLSLLQGAGQGSGKWHSISSASQSYCHSCSLATVDMPVLARPGKWKGLWWTIPCKPDTQGGPAAEPGPGGKRLGGGPEAGLPDPASRGLDLILDWRQWIANIKTFPTLEELLPLYFVAASLFKFSVFFLR